MHFHIKPAQDRQHPAQNWNSGDGGRTRTAETLTKQAQSQYFITSLHLAQCSYHMELLSLDLANSFSEIFQKSYTKVVMATLSVQNFPKAPCSN